MRRDTGTSAVVLAFGIVLLTAGFGFADTVSDFYRGRNITLTIGNEVGGGYDQYARTLAHHLGRFIPGKPNIVPKNLPAADGLAAAYRLYNTAPPDGSEIGIFHRGIPILPLVGQLQGLEFDAVKFGWIGSLNKEASICMSWHTSSIKTFQDMLVREFVVGVTAAGASLDTFEAPLMNAFNAKLKVVAGYRGGQNIDLAMERGEIDGRCGVSWSSLTVRNADWFRDRKINILLQFGLARHPDIPNIPLMQDLAQNSQDKEALKLLQIPTLIGRPFVAPPAIPRDRLGALRTAFNLMTKNPEFLTEAAKQRMEIQLVTGERVAGIIGRAFGTAPPVIRRAKELMKIENRS
jgi:tripartite-type tricarboxylate transporter receptor subunit TctC